METSDFTTLVKTSAFVDKSLLIQQAVSIPFAVINAPRLFGKSTNFDMLKRFFEIEVNDQGRPKSAYMNTGYVINDTINYKIFKENNLEILKNESIMINYFGKYPVISLDLKCEQDIRHEKDSAEVFIKALRVSYKQHKYLIDSRYLSERERHAVKVWCEDETSRSKTYNPIAHQVDVAFELYELARYLKAHFYGIKPVLLIDNHDSIFRNALLNRLDYDELDNINTVLVNILLYFKSKYSTFCFATGVLDLPVLGLQDLENKLTHRFLDLHQNAFDGFYGLTQEEIYRLLAKPEFKKTYATREILKASYGGYRSITGKHIYNMYSVLNFLKHGSIEHYWTKKTSLKTIIDTNYLPVITDIIVSILNNTLFPTYPEDNNAFRNYIDDDGIDAIIVCLRDPDKDRDCNNNHLKRFLTHLLLQDGYIFRRDIRSSYQIPNSEMKKALSELVK